MQPIDFRSWLRFEYWFDPQPGPMSVYYYWILAVATVVLLASLFIYGFYAERRWPRHYFKRRLARSITMASSTVSAFTILLVFNRQAGLPYVSMRAWGLALLLATLVVVAYYTYYMIWRYPKDLERWETRQDRVGLRERRSARRRSRRRR